MHPECMRYSKKFHEWCLWGNLPFNAQNYSIRNPRLCKQHLIDHWLRKEFSLWLLGLVLKVHILKCCGYRGNLKSWRVDLEVNVDHSIAMRYLGIQHYFCVFSFNSISGMFFVRGFCAVQAQLRRNMWLCIYQ